MGKSNKNSKIFNKISSSEVEPTRSSRGYNFYQTRTKPVSFLTEQEIYGMCDSCKKKKTHGERDSILIEVMFKCCLRISEAIALTPSCLGKVDENYVLLVKHGKGGLSRVLGINQSLYDRLNSYAYSHKLGLEDLFFPFTRFRGFQIIQQAAKDCHILGRRIYPHLLRHSGAVYRLKKNGGNLESLKRYLGHESPRMTIRYLKTLQQIESIEIEGKVKFAR
jgi:integrase